MMSRFIFTIFIFGICLCVSGQNVDSLKALYLQETTVVGKAEYALEIAALYEGTPVKTDSILPYLPAFEHLLKTNPNHKLAIQAKYFIGATYYHSDSAKMFSILKDVSREALASEDTATYSKALMQRAAKMRVFSRTYESIDLLSEGIKVVEGSHSKTAMLYNNRFSTLTASNYIKLGRFEDALKLALKAEDLALKSQDDKLLLRSYFSLSSIYGNLSSDEKKLVSKVERERYKELALAKMLKAFEICQGKPMSRSSGISAYNLGVYYSLDSQYVESKYYLNEAIKIGKALPYKELLFNAYDVIAEDYLISNQLDSADVYINHTERLGDELQYPFHQISAGFNRGKYLQLKNELTKARTLTQHFLNYAQDKELIDKERSLHYLLYEIENEAGNYKLALEHYIAQEKLVKQIAGEENIKKIEQLQAQFNHERQKNIIQELENDKQQQELKITKKNRFIGLAVFCGLLLSLFVYYKNREKVLVAEKKSLSAQQKLLRMQLNPHFLFNTLNSIQQYIYLKKEPKTVADYLAKFSQLVRRILQNSKEDFISLNTEIDFLKDYMDLQQLRFDSPFMYKINVDESLDVEEVLIPPMFTQPFIENSIEHGNLEKVSEGIIEINFQKNNDVLEIVIKDNGVGIDKTQFKLKNDKHRSLATKITYERLQSMKPQMKRKSKLEIIDLSNFDNKITGTQVKLNLPLLYK